MRAQQARACLGGGGVGGGRGRVWQKQRPGVALKPRSSREGWRGLCEAHSLLQTPRGNDTAAVAFAGIVIRYDLFRWFPHPTAIFQTKAEVPDKEPIKPHFFICFYFMCQAELNLVGTGSPLSSQHREMGAPSRQRL